MVWQKDPDGNDIWVPAPGEPSTPPLRDPFKNPFPGEIPIVTWLKNYFSEDQRLIRSGVTDPLERQRIIAERSPASSAPAVTQTETATSSPNWFMLSGMNPFYGPNVSENDRTQILNLLGKPPEEGGVGAVYVGGNGPTAQYRVGNITLSENDLLNQFFSKGINTKTAYGTTGGAAGLTAQQLGLIEAQTKLANANADAALAGIKQADEQIAIKQQDQIAAAAQQRFANAASIIGLQTNNQDLYNKGLQIAFEQGNAISQAQNRIQELVLQQNNLQQQYVFNASAANAAAQNAIDQFNAQMGFNVEQANVAAQEAKQQRLQSLASSIAEAAKAPGDYGKLAALTLANTGWGAPATAIAQGADLRTAESLAPTESLLRTRQDVMAQPDRPFSYTPIRASLIAAPNVAQVNPANFSTPSQTLTPAELKAQQDAINAKIKALGGGGEFMPKTPLVIPPPAPKTAQETGDWSAGTVESAPASKEETIAIAADTSNPFSEFAQLALEQGQTLGQFEKGGIMPRYEDGGANDRNQMNPFEIYKMLRDGGASEQQAADIINASLRSDEALARNTAAAAAAAPPEQPVYTQPSTSGYDEGDIAGNVSGWTPQIAQAQQQGNMQWVPAKTLTPEEFRKQENERKNREALESIFGGLMAYPGGGAGARGAGSLIDLAGLLRSPRTRVLTTEYAPVFDEIQHALIKKMPGVGYATGGIAPGAYISGERGPELNIPLGDKTLILNQKQLKAAGIDLKKLMSDANKPEQFADGGVFDTGWGNVQDQDRTLSMQFLNDALARARAGTPFQTGALPSPVYASSPGFSPLVTQVLGSLTSMGQGIPTEYFQELAAKYRPSGIRESVTQRSA